MEFMRSFILSVTISAMIVALAETLMPEGIVKKVGKLTGGMVLVLGILHPIVRLDYDELFLAANNLNEVTVETQEEGIEANDLLLKSIIEEELSAYILDKAKRKGYSFAVSVACEIDEEGTVVPKRAEMRGVFTEAQKEGMTWMIKEDLGIPEEDKIYVYEEVP